MYEYIKENYLEITSRIRDAAKRSRTGREPQVIVAIKYAQDTEVEYLARECGVRTVGENRVQQLLSRYELLKSLGLEVHFIGHLQTNKVKYIIDKVDMIHSLDRLSLAEEIDRQAKRVGRTVDVLVEINCAREESKDGLMPEEVEQFCREISRFENINLRGFMTMGRKCEKKSEYLKYFCETYQLVLDILQKKGHNVYGLILSMGMSDSFVPAAQAGATMIRIGRKMFNKN
jgi:pyridoxal phosphate enzyme (YggS family)